MELSSPKTKKSLLFSQKKSFFLKKRLLIFQKGTFQALKEFLTFWEMKLSSPKIENFISGGNLQSLKN